MNTNMKMILIRVIYALLNVIHLNIIQYIIIHKNQIIHYIVQMNVHRIKVIGIDKLNNVCLNNVNS